MESINRSYKEAFKKFFGININKLHLSNESSKKNSAELNRQLKQKISFSIEELNEYGNSINSPEDIAQEREQLEDERAELYLDATTAGEIARDEEARESLEEEGIDLDELSEEEQRTVIKERSADIAEEEMESEDIKVQEEIAQLIWGEEVDEEKKQRLQRALSRWSTTSDHLGISAFTSDYNQAVEDNDAEKIEELEDHLIGQGLTEEEAEKLILYVKENSNAILDRGNKKAFEYELNLARRHDAEHGTNIADEMQEVYEEVLPEEGEEAAREAAHEYFETAKQENTGLQEIIREEEQKWEEERQQILLESNEATTTTDVDLTRELDNMGALESFNQMDFDEQEVRVIEDLSRRGATPIIAEMLQNEGVRMQGGVQGRVADAYVLLHLDSGELEFIGEHAAENVASPRAEYLIDPPNPQGFDTMYITMLAEQNSIDLFSDPEGMVTNVQMARVMASDPEDNNIITVDDANRYRTFLKVMFGGNLEKGEENDRLYSLGIKSRTAQDVNSTRLEFFRRAMIQYMDRSDERGKDYDDFEVRYDDFQTLAMLWDTSSQEYGVLPSSTTELRQLTDSRLGAEEPDEVIAAYLQGDEANETA